MRKILFGVSFVSLLILLVFVTGCGHEHEWIDATCDTPITCAECGELVGKPAPHVWNEATCLSAKRCANCAITEGEPSTHKWEEATCLSAKHCVSCGITEGETSSHKWEEATCLSAKHCINCGKTEGEPSTHKWEEATCTSAKHCVNCGKTEGEPSSHKWEEATCTSAKHCVNCGKTEGKTSSHKWKEATCSSPKQCTSCHKTEGAPLEHVWSVSSSQAPSKCLNCGIVNPNDSSKKDETNYTSEELNKLAQKYVGEITCFDKTGQAISIGTGFVYTSDGKLITNYHVIDGAYSATITIDGKEHDIKSILGYDELIDLAILKIDGNNLPHATICNKESATGNTVYAIGSSRGLTNTFSKGIITYYNRILDNVSYIQHDASITNGNSGGPLINEFGEVIGINTWGINDSQNLNFAVSVSEINNINLNTTSTLSNFYEKNLKPNKILLEWLKNNYNYTGSNYYSFDIQKSEYEFFSLYYYPQDNSLYIDYYLEFDNLDVRYVSLSLDDSKSAYYEARYSDESGDTNDTFGYINTNQFTNSSALTYEGMEGGHWYPQSLLDTYQLGIVYLLGFFDEFLDYYYPELSLKDFGYNRFVPIYWEPYQVEEDDSTKVKNYIVNNGEYDSENNYYILLLNSYEYIEGYQNSHYAVYDNKSKTIDLLCIWDDTLFEMDFSFLLSMPDFQGIYEWNYIGYHVYEEQVCRMSGVLNANTFDYYYDNLKSDYHNSNVYQTLDCHSSASSLLFDLCMFMDEYFEKIGVTAEDMGFSNY